MAKGADEVTRRKVREWLANFAYAELIEYCVGEAPPEAGDYFAMFLESGYDRDGIYSFCPQESVRMDKLAQMVEEVVGRNNDLDFRKSLIIITYQEIKLLDFSLIPKVIREMSIARA